MKVLYGLQTTGNSHIIRSPPVIHALKARGHDVVTLLSGPSLQGRWNPQQFAPFEVRRGLTFVHEAGRIRYLRTGRQLRLLQFSTDIEHFRPYDFDLVVTDFEPVSARIARLRCIPSIGLVHLYAFNYNVPVAGGNLLTRAVMTRFAAVDSALGMHWHHFGQPFCRRRSPATCPSRNRRNRTWYWSTCPSRTAAKSATCWAGLAKPGFIFTPASKRCNALVTCGCARSVASIS